MFTETKQALVSCMNSVLDSKERITPTSEWLKSLPHASDRKRVKRMVQELLYQYTMEISALESRVNELSSGQ
jgi:hypothetical protein